MMPQRRCQHCNHRLPYAAARCNRCGVARDIPLDAPRARARSLRRRGLWIALALATVLGGGLAARNAPLLADWYAGFAARHLPSGLSSFAPAVTDQGAFFFCARQVAKKMDGDFSVETFPSPAESQAEEMADGRYRIVSWVDEARSDGGRVRHGFECLVRHERGRWSLDELHMEQYGSDGSPPAFARATN